MNLTSKELNTFEIVLEKDCKALNIAKKVMVVNDYYQYDKIFKVLLSEVNKELEEVKELKLSRVG